MGENRAAVPVYLRPLTKLFVWALVIFLALYFSRAFRKHCRLSPGQWRQALGQSAG